MFLNILRIFIAPLLLLTILLGCSNSGFQFERQTAVELGAAAPEGADGPPLFVPEVVPEEIEDGEDPPPSSTPTPRPPDLDPDCSGEGIEFIPQTGAGSQGQIYVLSQSSTEATAILRVAETGNYQLFNVFAESGNSQRNESAFLRVVNSENETGYPFPQGNPPVPNCFDSFVVVDSDNETGANDDPVYLGTFRLIAGEDNLLMLSHYCPLYRAGGCMDLHIENGPGDNSECTSGNANSVHVKADGFCLSSQ